MVLILFFEVFVCKINVWLKFGSLRIGFLYNKFFKVLNVCWVFFVYFILFGWFFFVRFVKGIVIIEKFGINFL